MKSKYFLSVFIVFILLIQSAFALGKKDTDSDSKKSDSTEEEKIPNEYITIDLLLDTKKQNPKNHFNWKDSGKSSSSSSSTNSDNSYKDYFDAVSGASKVHSTKNFRDVVLDSSKKNLRTPKGLRNLCLFAVANPETLSKDNFLVTQEGKKLTITFTHRENSYRIETDENGMLQVPEGFFVKLKAPKDKKDADKSKNDSKNEKAAKDSKDSKTAKESKEAKKDSKPQKASSDEDLNLDILEEDFQESPSEAQPEDDFQKDEPPESLNAIFIGKLTANLTGDGIFTLKGKIKLTKRQKPEEVKEEKSKEEDKEEPKAEETKEEDKKSEITPTEEPESADKMQKQA